MCLIFSASSYILHKISKSLKYLEKPLIGVLCLKFMVNTVYGYLNHEIMVIVNFLIKTNVLSIFRLYIRFFFTQNIGDIAGSGLINSVF